MDTCETCGNRYENMMLIRYAGKEHHFDSFECAIHVLAPRCQNCGVPVLGHGVEIDHVVFCCAHCARIQGERGICDHVQTQKDSTRWAI